MGTCNGTRISFAKWPIRIRARLASGQALHSFRAATNEARPTLAGENCPTSDTCPIHLGNFRRPMIADRKVNKNPPVALPSFWLWRDRIILSVCNNVNLRQKDNIDSRLFVLFGFNIASLSIIIQSWAWTKSGQHCNAHYNFFLITLCLFLLFLIML